jgi:hypothetical protein
MFAGPNSKECEGMLRKTFLALFAVASIGLLSPTVASARGGFGGGGFHGGGFHGGGFHGGGFHGGGFHGGGFHRGFGGAALGLGLGLGLAGAYAAYPYGGYYGYPYAYGDYYGDGGCYLVRRRIWTPYGWRIRRAEVCD